jgi:hypothetical protein
MQELRKRRAGSDKTVEEEAEEAEIIISLEKQIENFWDMRALLEGFAVSIRPPAIEMPLLKRLGVANFVPEPGLEAYLRQAFQVISQQAVKVAFRPQSLV